MVEQKRWNPRDEQKHDAPVREHAGHCGSCDKDIHDAPSTDHLPDGRHHGYMACYPARHPDGSPKVRTEHGDNGRSTVVFVQPAGNRVLCKVCYLDEFHEMYPEQPEPDMDSGWRHTLERLGLGDRV